MLMAIQEQNMHKSQLEEIFRSENDPHAASTLNFHEDDDRLKEGAQ